MIHKLIKIVTEEQEPNGSFPSFSAPISDWPNGHDTKTTFFTSIILGSLGESFKNEGFDKKTKIAIFSKACYFLLLEKSSNWTWGYWGKKSPEIKQFPIPDDLDDTFLAASALYSQNKIPPNAIAKLIQTLIKQEVRIGGPYKTWIVPKNFSKKWQDVDIAVNCNIAYFLMQNNVELKSIQKLIDQVILKKGFESKYYPTIYPILYFISRVYKGKNKDQLTGSVLSKLKNDRILNPQNIALSTTSLIDLGFRGSILKSNISHLQNLSLKEIQAYPFCLDPKQESKQYAAGSKALTAILILESIKKFKAIIKIQSNAGEKFYSTILKIIKKQNSKLKSPIKEKVKYWTDHVLKSDTNDKIILMSFWANNSKSTKISQLSSLATFYGWMTYLLQDKMLDKEADADLNLIPIANYFNRQLQNTVADLEALKPGARKLFNNLTAKMDLANELELVNRQPKLLSDKSIGFSFGPVLIDPKLKQFFEHYLIARQLNDDAHDWEEDLLNGRLNSVGLQLTSKWQKLNPREKIALNKAIPKLRPLFWNEIIVKVANQINHHCKEAKKINNNFPLLIQPLENAAEKVLKENQNYEALLKIFQN